MAIEALYPSRRYPQSNNPLLRRERRRQQQIAALALVLSALSMAALRVVPNEAAAESRAPAVQRAATMMPQPHRPIRVIPLYTIPPEQAAGIFSYRN
ncbi:hypothetical protein [uncultured Methylovirgula sp.]|uniref:hypothetical protein n=1 Tax=uncultured Methylovirgula sp. TaxID=1285960 RepID=UPI002618AB75|nr:hypothetical protein [uncultured Methylovirgula sp.]